ncbi:MAG: hypothetical protein HY976_04195 [Candidatus Kerfeldbacteria bacterium]|nr:hypothetical protein [Candidatus Kerfeldbacteria bacterium]
MIKRTAFIAVVSALAWFGLGATAQAAIIYPFSHTVEVPLNSTVTVDVRLDSQNEVINAVETVLIYDPAALEVVSINSADSLLTLWTETPSLSSSGQISLSGGRPDGTLSVGGRLVSVAFRTLQLGPTKLAIQPALSGVYRHDGYGTATEVTGRPLELNVIDSLNLLSQPTSPSHPIEGQWSNARDFVLAWVPYKNAAVSYRLSRDPLADPDQLAEENRGQMVFPGLDDGLWYLTFTERFPGQPWSGVLHREIRIDANPPPPFDLTLVRDDGAIPYVAFSVRDRESGIVRYTARIERSRWWTPWLIRTTEQAVNGPFAIADIDHVSKISVTAYDAAGNTRTASLTGPGRPDARWVLLATISTIVVLCVILIQLIQPRSRRYRRKKHV